MISFGVSIPLNSSAMEDARAIVGIQHSADRLAGILPVAFGIYLVTRPAKRLRLC